MAVTVTLNVMFATVFVTDIASVTDSATVYLSVISHRHQYHHHSASPSVTVSVTAAAITAVPRPPLQRRRSASDCAKNRCAAPAAVAGTVIDVQSEAVGSLATPASSGSRERAVRNCAGVEPGRSGKVQNAARNGGEERLHGSDCCEKAGVTLRGPWFQLQLEAKGINAKV